MLIIKKQTSKVVHGGAEAWDGMHPLCNTSDGSGWVPVEGSTAVTCKKCLNHIEKAERLGLHLEVRHNADGSSRVVDTRTETVADRAPRAEVAISRYSANEAIATAAFSGRTVGGHATRERGRWTLRAEGRTVRAKTLGKAAKLWARDLGFHATDINVETIR